MNVFRLIVGLSINTATIKIKELIDKVYISFPSFYGNQNHRPMPVPTIKMLNGDPIFDAIYDVVKFWDINIPSYYTGYCGGNGSHATLIYEAIMKVKLK